MAYDILVIGSGPGGYVAAIRAAQLGMRVGIIERERLGGICLNWGCIPTKALLKSAQVFDYANHASEYGVLLDKSPRVDFSATVARSRKVADTMSQGVRFLLKKNKIDFLEGTAQVQDAQHVQVQPPKGAPQTHTAKHIILATGARPKQLKELPIDGLRVIDYRGAMTLKKQPKSLIVVGSGAIGMEFAYFYATLGTQVTVVEALPAILPREDAIISETALRLFSHKGIVFHTDAQLKTLSKRKGSTALSIVVKGQTLRLSASVILSAVGVEANTEMLNLSALGIKTVDDKIATDPYGATSCAGIYAIGDVTPGPALAHVASAQGIVCVEHIAGKNPTPIDMNNIPSCTYCHPEIASVGYTEAQARKQGYELKIGTFPFKASGKAQAEGSPDGLIKVIYDAKYGEWLGAHMIGDGVTELIAEVVAARQLETTGEEIIRSIHPHPTRSEALMEATAAAYGEVIHL